MHGVSLFIRDRLTPTMIMGFGLSFGVFELVYTLYIIGSLKKGINIKRIKALSREIEQRRNWFLLAINKYDKNFIEWVNTHLVTMVKNNMLYIGVREGKLLLLRYPKKLVTSYKRSFWSFAPMLLIALGVLGTFAGIVLGLQEIPTNFIDIGNEKLTGDMFRGAFNLIDGMKIAFNTSLAGLGTAAIFIFWLAFCSWVRESYRKRILGAYEKYIIMDDPLLVLRQGSEDRELQSENIRVQKEAAERLSIAAVRIGESLGNFRPETIGEIISKSIENVFKDELRPALVGMLNRLENIQAIMASQHETILKNLLADLRKEVFEPIGERLDESAVLIKSTSDAVKMLKSELGDITKGIASAVKTIEFFQTSTMNKMESFAKDLKIILDGYRDETKHVLEEVSSKINEAVEESIHAMEAQRDAFKESAENASNAFKNMREELSKALDKRIEEEVKMLKDTKEGVIEILMQAQNTFQDQSSTLKNIGFEASKLMDRSRENLSDVLSNIDNVLLDIQKTIGNELEMF
ncbi:MAG: hypothetical protein GXP49_08085, partial [Deltaproteobacteria bacterium]|nr:hypothetical protein [Deltaproteobacteria bacterium]